MPPPEAGTQGAPGSGGGAGGGQIGGIPGGGGPQQRVTRSHKEDRLQVLAAATTELQGSCFLEQHHPDDIIRLRLNKGPRSGDVTKQKLYRVMWAAEGARAHPSFSMSFWPIHEFKKQKRGWRKKVPWDQAKWHNNIQYNKLRSDVGWADVVKVRDAVRLTMQGVAGDYLRNPQRRASDGSQKPVAGWQEGVPLTMPEVARRR